MTALRVVWALLSIVAVTVCGHFIGSAIRYGGDWQTPLVIAVVILCHLRVLAGIDDAARAS